MPARLRWVLQNDTAFSGCILGILDVGFYIADFDDIAAWGALVSLALKAAFPRRVGGHYGARKSKRR
jgi:hypothetical protein